MASVPPTLSALPMDAHVKILHVLDWTSLGRFACVSRYFNTMVKGINAIPLWRNEISEGYPDDRDPSDEVRRLVDKLRFGARPDLCLVFASKGRSFRDYTLDANPLHTALSKELPGCCSVILFHSEAVIGRSGEEPPVEQDIRSPALSISLIHLPPGANLRVSPLRSPSSRSMGAELQDLPQDAHILLLMSAADNLPMTWHHIMSHRMPDAISVGGMGSGRNIFTSVAPAHASPSKRDSKRRFLAAGVVALAFHGPAVDICSYSVRGLQLRRSGHRIDSIGAPEDGMNETVVTGVTGGKFLPVGRRQGWEFHPDAVEGLEGATEQETAAAVLAEAVEDMERSNFDVAVPWRADTGFSREFCNLEVSANAEGWLTGVQAAPEIRIEGRISPGAVLTGGDLTADQSAADFAHTLEAAKERLGQEAPGSKSVLGSFMFSCLGRGPLLYGTKNKETAMLQAAFPGIPVSGFFANGEYGPPPRGESYLGGEMSSMLIYSTVLTFVRLRAGLP